MTDPADRLINRIRQSSAPLPILPLPDLPPDLEARSFDASPGAPSLGGIQAVLFDVYGTLFISAAGDISLAAKEPGSLAGDAGANPALHQSLDNLAGEYGLSAETLRDYFQGEVLKRHGKLGFKEKLPVKTAYPELRVEELWADFLKQRSDSVTTMDDSRELALRYELAVNPVYPMPGAEETLGILRDRGMLLGLISNAQFFTPLLFETFFNATPEALGFDPELLIYSYELGEAKPSPALFTPAVRRLEALGLKPENALYVGNDMLNDIFAAAQAGFKTVLFAGDRRSLRLREGDAQVQGVRPDRVIRDLREVRLL
ncbi:hydrolase [Spirochaetia bacterium]|nr:hydrolase [Spirochaetia bacterium]